MTIKRLLALCAIAGAIHQLPATARAFECPQHFAEAQTAINKVKRDMERMETKMPHSDIAFVHSLLDDAHMLLGGARHNHSKSNGYHDHTRAIVKAETARGYALAAEILHINMMKKLAAN